MKLRVGAKKKQPKHFRNSTREATEIQLLTNLAFKIVEFQPELPISHVSQHEAREYQAIQIFLPLPQVTTVHNEKQFDFLKNRFHSQLLPLNTHF